MNYTNIYQKLVDKALKENTDKGGVYEKHHIKPRSMGGSDSKSNLVHLTPRQHFIAHRLLEKMTKGTPDHYKMLKAVYMMSHKGASTKHITNSRTYGIIREKYLHKNKCFHAINVGKPSHFYNLDLLDLDKVKCHREIKHKALQLITSSPYYVKSKIKPEILEKTLLLVFIMEKLRRLGFKGLVRSQGKRVGTSSIAPLSRLVKWGLVTKDGTFDCHLLESTFKGIDDRFFNKQYHTENLVTTVKNVTKLFRKLEINKDRFELIHLDRVYCEDITGYKAILRPYNNWLTPDHPLADYMCRPLEESEAIEALHLTCNN